MMLDVCASTIVLCSLISPYQESRDQVRRMHGNRFLEVYVAAPVDICAARDVKGVASGSPRKQSP